MAKQSKPKDSPKTNQPAEQFRLGRIKAVLWANQGDGGVWYNVKITRLYKDNDDQWQDSDSFSRDDLPLVREVARQAWVWIYEQTQKAT